VGTGIGPGQLTIEARAAITAADRVLYLAADVLTEHQLHGLAAGATSLGDCYGEDGPGLAAYERMAEAILAPARAGERVCAAFYGHPGVFVLPAGEAIRRARSEGIDARMLPGVSSLDCLFADLGVDPAAAGLQTYEASDFLRRRPALEPRAALVLWQVGVLESVDGLATALLETFPQEHGLVVYEATPYPGVAPRSDLVPLAELPLAQLSQRSTLYVQPLP
jgi:uncharacterized protein YabN with tetrapyrrole methylase and pyrophosphatase domain